MNWFRWSCGILVLVVLTLGIGRPAAAQLHVGEYDPADVQRGSQLFATRCSTCHGNGGEQVPGVSVLSGRFRRASTDDDLAGIIKGGIPGTAMPKGSFTPVEVTGLVAYLRTAMTRRSESPANSQPAGNAEHGRELFKGQCATCHRVNGDGGWRGPNLSDIGAHRSARSLMLSLVQPSAEIIPLNQEVRVVTREGRTIVGRRMNEDTHSIQLILEEQGRLVSLMKSGLREMVPSTTSPMPSYQTRMSSGELSDVLAYLQILKFPE